MSRGREGGRIEEKKDTRAGRATPSSLPRSTPTSRSSAGWEKSGKGEGESAPPCRYLLHFSSYMIGKAYLAQNDCPTEEGRERKETKKKRPIGKTTCINLVARSAR